MKPGRKNKLIELLLHPAVLALPVAVLVIAVLPDAFDKYSVFPVHEQIIRKGLVIEYADLNHDGISERYTASDNGKGGSAIVVYNQSGPLFHWDFEGKYLPGRPHVIVGDYDSNNHDELYTFTLKGDSLLLNGIDYRHLGKFSISNRFLTRHPRFNGEIDFALTPIGVEDLNGDGFKEIIYAVSAGYSISPRRVFAYDVKRDSLFSSPDLGGHIVEFDVRDIDGDNKAEIAVTNYGPGNMQDKSLPMHDTCAYVIILDNDLSFLFPPIISPGRFNGINNRFLFSGGKFYIASYWSYNSQLSGNPVLYIYDIAGNLMHERRFSNGDRTKYRSMLVIPGKDGNEHPILISQYNKIQIYDLNLNPVNQNLPETGPKGLSFFDFDQDGENEICFESARPGEWIILRTSFQHPVVFQTYLSTENPHIFSIKRGSDKPQFSFQLGEHNYIYEYAFNPAYYWKYPVYGVVYLLVLFFILLIRNLQRVQLRKKYETERKMAELQLLSLRNQMDPHFTFNVLNTIGSVILQNKSDESYDMLMKFSKMIRTTINSANIISRPLEEELNFVKNYLDLQQIRHEGYFTYQVNIDPDVNTSQPVPKMILQTYVENALKHGLVPRKGGGDLLISVTKKENHLELSVQDNGVGRQQAKINGSTSTGVGLSILSQYYQVLNRENYSPIIEEFIDLFDEKGNPAGTRVVVNIPEGFVFPGSPVKN